MCVFFSLSESKLIPYILPALPALALLIASLPADALRRDVLMTAVLTLVAAAALAMLCMFAPRFVAASDRSEYFLSLTQAAWPRSPRCSRPPVCTYCRSAGAR